ncbi:MULTISPECIES: winged helix-turn-helix domain-containing protein [unclassified Pseudoalteromonas]|uniref:winged helix-turn-helix domain-containing protein n=1 Tax=unclassified Pseudoalteromonas TaxID=194690 RepID=UPI0020969270|nr:winged helix-turn-helix domain-containing protein [Pseudoalteromonas sp. XMcav2-N]MCO7186839.1 winged helix-turn-helix domain-containing protein [Pseudoalteromonas sp. XMcav2-N]
MEFQFANARLNIATQCVIINERSTQLDDRAFLLLNYLLQRRPQVCSHAELVKLLWPNTVVSDWSLPKLVSDLRSQLNRAGLQQNCIVTVRGQGYRFAPAIEVTEHQATGSLMGAVGSSDTAAMTDQPVQMMSVREHNALPARYWLPVLVIACLCFVGLMTHSTEQTPVLRHGEPVDAIGRILWVDDNPQNNLQEKRYFERHHIGVYPVKTTEEALLLLQMYEYNLIISDMGRAEEPLAGLKLLQQLRATGNQTPYYFYTLIDSQEMLQVIENSGGQGVATKRPQLYGKILSHFATKNIDLSN